MIRYLTLLSCVAIGLAACAPTEPPSDPPTSKTTSEASSTTSEASSVVASMPVEQAMTECRARIKTAKNTMFGIGIGFGTKSKSGTGVSIGANFDLEARRRPHETYQKCVVEKAGVAPTEPLYPTGA